VDGENVFTHTRHGFAEAGGMRALSRCAAQKGIVIVSPALSQFGAPRPSIDGAGGRKGPQLVAADQL